MIRRSSFGMWAVLVFAVICFATVAVSAEQTQGAPAQAGPAQNGPAQEKTSTATSPAQLADVSGDWQVSWEVRLGTNQGTLHLQQRGGKLTGTFKDLHGLSSLSGSVDENRISFDVQFQGPHPFAMRFTGSVTGGKIEGTSQAVGVNGDGGAFLGHGGEVVHPEHPWSATRVTGEPAHSGEPGAQKAPAGTPAGK